MPALNSLVTQQANSEPPNVQGQDTGQASGLQGLVGQGQQQQQPMQPPSHQETAAILQHISAFRRRWVQILKDPEIGTKDVRSEVHDMMADMMAESYASLPEVMGLLKTVPTNPLEQKQWIEKHVQNDDQAMQSVLQHYAANPVGGPMGPVNNDNRAALVKGAVSRYKAHGKRHQSGRPGGIPLA